MFSSIFYIILAILGIDFLILIHELGHYFMARKLGITVEEFAVGFGKPLYQWQRKGVKWKIGMIPFGGYVKMAGMEKKGLLDPHQVEGGFLAQKPWNQIKVAAMGPIVNIVFAFIVFSFLWMIGGREKPFSEYTHHIGWVNHESGPYKYGIRAGDLITHVNGKPFENFESFLYRAIYDSGPLQMAGKEIYWGTGESYPFTYAFEEGKNLKGVSKAAGALGALGPAQFLLYDKMPSGAQNELLPGSPLDGSGIQYGDRLVWVDGKYLFSKKELIETINEPRILLTVERDGKVFLTRVPSLAISDIRLSERQKEEIDDWRAAGKINIILDRTQFIPYDITSSLTVEAPLSYIDSESRVKQFFESEVRIPYEIPLAHGDKILAVSGIPVTRAYELLAAMQERKVLIIVDQTEYQKPIKWTETTQAFDRGFEMHAIEQIASSIGTGNPLLSSGKYRLLKSVTPVRLRDFPLLEADNKARSERLQKWEDQINKIKDPKLRGEAIAEMAQYQNRLMLGLTLQDQLVSYNPSPFFLMGDVFGQIVKTLKSLLTGSLSPKYMAGPIGIVQVIQYGWSQGVKEALFFLGMISLNLGILNLFPIPVLDGGHILFAFYEMVTRKPLPIKTRERLIFPFIILLIAVFIYFSFNDIVRIVTQFF